MTDERIKENLGENETCPATGYQTASLCVPVKITPFAKPGTTTTKCCGSPFVSAGIDVCEGEKNGSCFFTITQDICVSVPILFGATEEVGDVYVSCDKVSADDICMDCGNVGSDPGCAPCK